MSNNTANKTMESADKKYDPELNIAVSTVLEIKETKSVDENDDNNSCPSCGLMRKGYESAYHNCIRVLN